MSYFFNFLCVFFLLACSPIGRFDYVVKHNPSSLDEKSPIDEKVKKTSKKPDSTTDTPKEPVEYPVLEFVATGSLELLKYGSYNITSDINIKTSEKSIQYTFIKKMLTHKDGKNYVNEVDKKISSSAKRVVFKTAPDVLKNLEANQFKNLDVLIYTDRIQDNNKTCNFSPPIPIFVIPKSYENAYDDLNSPIIYDSTVSDCVFQNQELIDLSIQCTVQKQNSNYNISNLLPISITCNITSPQDQKGEYYQQLPIPQVATFYINTKNKEIQEYKETSPLLSTRYEDWKSQIRYGDKGSKSFHAKLCKSSTKSHTNTYKCE